MDSLGLERLERIVRNMPIQNIDWMRTECEHGPIYIALGRGPSTEPQMDFISWQGAYGIMYGGQFLLGRPGEVSGRASKMEAVQHFLGDANYMYESMYPRDMLDGSYSLAR